MLVELLSANYPAYILDADYHVTSTMQHGDVVELCPGDHLHIGLYILRYDAASSPE